MDPLTIGIVASLTMLVSGLISVANKGARAHRALRRRVWNHFAEEVGGTFVEVDDGSSWFDDQRLKVTACIDGVGVVIEGGFERKGNHKTEFTRLQSSTGDPSDFVVRITRKGFLGNIGPR